MTVDPRAGGSRSGESGGRGSGGWVGGAFWGSRRSVWVERRESRHSGRKILVHAGFRWVRGSGKFGRWGQNFVVQVATCWLRAGSGWPAGGEHLLRGPSGTSRGSRDFGREVIRIGCRVADFGRRGRLAGRRGERHHPDRTWISGGGWRSVVCGGVAVQTRSPATQGRGGRDVGGAGR